MKTKNIVTNIFGLLIVVLFNTIKADDGLYNFAVWNCDYCEDFCPALDFKLWNNAWQSIEGTRSTGLNVVDQTRNIQTNVWPDKDDQGNYYFRQSEFASPISSWSDKKTIVAPPNHGILFVWYEDDQYMVSTQGCPTESGGGSVTDMARDKKARESKHEKKELHTKDSTAKEK